ncbi:MAG: UDP-N-acetylmuramoyl-L-alanine--D-glutamate ligase [Methylococcaceae bacterium]|nr:UDP-N-acetylmuramoyl-L-alanine--D-glutamate ligase [Methylococcaceae bacterium]
MDSTAIKALLKKHFDLDEQHSKVVVVGLGDTGVSVAYYLQRMGFKFAICDSRNKPPVSEAFYQEMVDIPVFTGGFNEDAFRVATHLIVSPGVALNENAIRQAVAHGAKVLSDIDLFACSVNAPIIGISGSNGKSTVTTMVGEMLKASGKRVGVGGNIGIPALDLLGSDVSEDNAAELYVLELSSFQLERTSALNAVAATVLNVSADHLDRHPDMATYAKVKEHVYDGDGFMIINADDSVVSAMRREGRKTLTFSVHQKADFYILQTSRGVFLMHDAQSLMPLAELPLEGRHNAANALAALALGFAVGLDTQAMCNALRKFRGLDHRMQRVAEIGGVTWINDSKATNIGACIAALQGYQNKVILIAGGDAKGADMNELTSVIKEKTKGVVLIGKDANLIDAALNGCVPTYAANTMTEAVKIAAGLARAGECVLLSPACASLDQYKNYKDRGEQFKQAVLELAI